MRWLKSKETGAGGNMVKSWGVVGDKTMESRLQFKKHDEMETNTE